MELNELASDIMSQNENDENNNLISKDTNNINSYNEQGIFQQRKNIFFRLLKIPLIYLLFFLVVVVSFTTIIFLIISYKEKENFYVFQIPWDKFYLNDRTYENYHFDNGLEVMIIQDNKFDMDGGAIVINKGYMDNPKEEGIASFATMILNEVFYSKEKQLKLILSNYFGEYAYETEEYFTNFRFNILNAGFKKFLQAFSSILNEEKIYNSVDKIFKNTTIINYIKENMETIYLDKNFDFYNKENHLLEYLVYNFGVGYAQEILPEGSKTTIGNYTLEDLKNMTLNHIKKLINPKNIKIVIFSKYKFLISSKYMKKYFQYLINKKTNEDTEKKENPIKNITKLKTSQIIYIRGKNYDNNYIKIIYYIDKKENESDSEAYYKKGYFNYIKDILSETKEGSLYSLLTNNFDLKIKSIIIYYDYILKSKIAFYIEIQLNCLNNINDIIFLTYQYMHKIIKEGIGNNIQIDRYLELKDVFNQTLRYLEKTYETIDLAKNNGINIFQTKFRQYYYFYPYWVPWELNMTFEENIKKIKNESSYYFEQLKPENSVIVLGIKNNDINKITCNENSSFPLNCSFFKDKNNVRETIYYNVSFINTTFNSCDFEIKLDIDNKAKISYVRNKYISKYINIIPEQNEPEQKTIDISTKILNNCHFKRNINVRIPKVFISINLLHPFLRPLTNDESFNNCTYFQILEFFSAIKRKANDLLADAIRAGNEIDFNYNENYLYINIFCYEDIAYNIVKVIKNITFDIIWENSDFIINNEMYKYETIDYFFNFDFHTVEDLGKYYFYCRLKNGLFNKYEFSKRNFEYLYDKYCFKNITENVKYLNKFIVNSLIYGYINKSEAEKISELFDRENNDEEMKEIILLLGKVNNNITIENFTNWTNEINQLTETGNNNSVNINENIINKAKANLGYRYISLSSDFNFSKNYMELSLLDNMFKSINRYNLSNLIDFGMLSYRDIYFYFIVEEDNNQDINPNNDSLIEVLMDKMMEEAQNEYNQSVDKIGDRFYYLQKNLELVLFKRKSSLISIATEELNYKIYNNSILHPEEIIREYNNNKKGKNYKFDDLKHYFKDINKNKKFDVNTVKKNNSFYN